MAMRSIRDNGQTAGSPPHGNAAAYKLACLAFMKAGSAGSSVRYSTGALRARIRRLNASLTASRKAFLASQGRWHAMSLLHLIWRSNSSEATALKVGSPRHLAPRPMSRWNTMDWWASVAIVPRIASHSSNVKYA
jgi:hypothetical protein